MKKTGIYEILNTTDGKRYIGQAADVALRWRLHQSALRRGKHHSILLQRAWDKHGEAAFAFNLLFECGADELTRLEQAAMDHFHAEYNIAPAAGSPLGIVRSAETRKKIGDAQRGKKRGPRSAEVRAKISVSHMGKTHTSEARAKISEVQRGRVQSAAHVAKRSVALTGLKRTEETRAKMSARMKGVQLCLGRVIGPETRAKISASLMGHTHSAATRAKLSDAGRGQVRSEEFKRNASIKMKAIRQRQREALANT